MAFVYINVISDPRCFSNYIMFHSKSHSNSKILEYLCYAPVVLLQSFLLGRAYLHKVLLVYDAVSHFQLSFADDLPDCEWVNYWSVLIAFNLWVHLHSFPVSIHPHSFLVSFLFHSLSQYLFQTELQVQYFFFASCLVNWRLCLSCLPISSCSTTLHLRGQRRRSEFRSRWLWKCL